jgi:hypothetical protein
MKNLFKLIVLLLLYFNFIGCNYDSKKTINNNTLKSENLQKADSTNSNRFKKFELQLQSADSILLVSHEQTYGPVFSKKDSSYKEANRIVEDGILNKKVINKTILIDGNEKKTLINILTQKIKGEPIDLAACFDPHHALIVISAKDISYIEFCFICGGVATDKIEISSADFDKEKWNRVYNYIDGKMSIKK